MEEDKEQINIDILKKELMRNLKMKVVLNKISKEEINNIIDNIVKALKPEEAAK